MKKAQICPRCRDILMGNGSKNRSFRDGYGDSYCIKVRLFWCKNCNIFFSEIPDCLEYRGRYLTDIKNGAILEPENYKGGPADVTLWRWRKK